MSNRIENSSCSNKLTRGHLALGLSLVGIYTAGGTVMASAIATGIYHRIADRNGGITEVLNPDDKTKEVNLWRRVSIKGPQRANNLVAHECPSNIYNVGNPTQTLKAFSEGESIYEQRVVCALK